MADQIRAELEALVAAYDEHGGRWPEEDVQALAGAVERARAALAAHPQPAPPPAPEGDSIRAAFRAALERLIGRMRNERASGATVDAWAAEARAICAALDAQLRALAADTQQLREIAHAASDFLCGKRFPAFAETHGGLNLLEAQLARLLAHLEHGPRPVPGVDVPGPDGDYGGLQELCEAEGVDVRIGGPLLQRARKAWRQTDRLHVLQQEGHRFREPERTILCDILANGGLLPDPEGKRYGMPAASTPLDLYALLSPEGAYERGGTGQEPGAQLVSGPHGNSPEWWVPLYGSNTLDNLLDLIRARILPHLRPPVAGIDVPGGDGDYGCEIDLCAAEGVDPMLGIPLLNRARQVWGMGEPPPPTPALDADTLKEVFAKAIARNWQTGWPALANYIALAVEAQRVPSRNPPATEEDLADTSQEVAGFDNELLHMALRHLALVQARDGREYSSALCERAAELIRPASDGERERLASQLDSLADGFDQGTPEERALERGAAVLRQRPAPAVVPVAAAERLPQAEDCSFNPGAVIGSCWCWSPPTYPSVSGWWSFGPLEWAEDATYWLPAHAIPIPQPPQGEEVE